MNQLNELFASRDEIRLAVYLYENADFSAHVDIAVHYAFGCDSVSLLRGGSHTLFSEIFYSLVNISVCLYKRFFAVHHADSRLLTKSHDVRVSEICHN